VKETIFSFLYFSLFIVINVIVLLSTDSLHTHPVDYQENNLAYAHIFGAGQTTKNIDNYQIKFRTSPSVILADDNSTTRLNFSIQQNNTDVYNVFAALTIEEKIQIRLSHRFLIIYMNLAISLSLMYLKTGYNLQLQ
jgi:hypothetical protein